MSNAFAEAANLNPNDDVVNASGVTPTVDANGNLILKTSGDGKKICSAVKYTDDTKERIEVFLVAKDGGIYSISNNYVYAFSSDLERKILSK